MSDKDTVIIDKNSLLEIINFMEANGAVNGTFGTPDFFIEAAHSHAFGYPTGSKSGEDMLSKATQEIEELKKELAESKRDYETVVNNKMLSCDLSVIRDIGFEKTACRVATTIEELKKELDASKNQQLKIFKVATDLIDFELLTEFEDRVYSDNSIDYISQLQKQTIENHLSYEDAAKLVKIMFRRGHSNGAFSADHEREKKDFQAFVKFDMPDRCYPEKIEPFIKWFLDNLEPTKEGE